MDKKAMQVEESKGEKLKDVSMASNKEKIKLQKRTANEFFGSLSQMTTREVRQKLKSPTHFIFIFGIECKFISKVSFTS
jgi:hypothetical protein